MGVNTMDYEQAAPILNQIIKMTTGSTQLQTVQPADFVSVATTTLQQGYDKVLNAITQLIGRTIFSVRPYSRKLSDLYMTSLEWGSIIRKLKLADVDWDTSMVFELTDGQSVDPWIVKKPNVLQLNIYGQNVATLQYPSITREQLRTAFSGPAELNNFVSMIMTTIDSQKEQKSEAVARMLITNFIGGRMDEDAGGVIHLLTEYNAQTGESLTPATVYAPDNFPNFIYWLYARLETLAGLMSERSQLYQTNITGKVINQHTDGDRLKVKMYAPFMSAINARVKATTFNDSYLRMADTEAMNFWQSINTPNSIDVVPTYLNTNGAVKTGERQQSNAVLGVMYDVDAMGIVTQLDDALATPVNPRGLYYNTFYHMAQKWFSDFSEKGVVLLLD